MFAFCVCVVCLNLSSYALFQPCVPFFLPPSLSSLAVCPLAAVRQVDVMHCALEFTACRLFLGAFGSGSCRISLRELVVHVLPQWVEHTDLPTKRKIIHTMLCT